MKAMEKHFPVLLLKMLYKVVLTLDSTDNKSYYAVVSKDTVYYTVQGDSRVWTKSQSLIVQMKAI